jgi:Ca-activated chloride channel homolog
MPSRSISTVCTTSTVRKILVVYSDGGDTRSAVSFADTMVMLKASDVTVYAIGFLQNQPQSVRNGQRMRLTQIAEVTGGEAYFPYSSRNLDAIYDKILEQVRAQYNLGFAPLGRRDGTWRRLDVRLTNPEHRDLKVRSRKGYFAPHAGFARGAQRPEP